VRLLQRLNAAVVLVSAAVEELQALVRRAPDQGLVLLHGDISGANLLWASRPVLIDWEYARLGDPADELAYLFTQNGLSRVRQEAFWRVYSASVEQSQLASMAERVRLWVPIALFGSVLWWLDAWSRKEGGGTPVLVDASHPRTIGYYLGQAVLRLDRFELH